MYVHVVQLVACVCLCLDVVLLSSLTCTPGQRLSLACGPALEPGPADALAISPLDSESGSLRANGRAQNAFSLAKKTLLVDWLQNCANSFPDNTLYSLVNSKVIVDGFNGSCF